MIYRDMGLSWKYLFRDIFGHITPLYRLVQAVALRVVGLNFGVLRAVMIGTALLPTGLLILIGNRLKIPLQISTSSALLIAVLPQISQAEFWWSNGLLVLPGLAAVFACLWLLIGKSGAGPSSREVWLASAVFIVGLGFYDKVLFAPVVFLGVSISLKLKDRAIIPAALSAIFDMRYIIAASIVWAVALAVLRDPSPPAPALSAAARFMWLSWNEAAVAGMLGVGGAGLNVGGPVISILFAEGIIAGAIAWTILRRGRFEKRAIFVWIGIMVYVAVTVALTARMRAQIFGADYGRLLRYAVEPAAFIIAGLVIASAGRGLRRPWIAATAILAIAINVMVVSDVPLLGDPAGTLAYIRHIRESYSRVAGTAGIVVLDDSVPENIMPAWMSPWNVQSKFLPLLGLKRYPVSGPPLATWEIDATGTLRQRK
jgi:hypothetical protein